jgi:Geminivirus Rep catalytic domain
MELSNQNTQSIKGNKPLSPLQENKSNNHNKNFRCQSSKIFLTIKGKYDEDYIKKISNIQPINKWIYCNEISEDNYEHSHFGIMFKKKLDIKNPRIFDNEGVHPNFSSVKSWQNVITYITKDHEYKSNFTVNQMAKRIDNIINSNTLIDAFKNNAEKMSDILPISQIYKCKGFLIDKELINEIKSIEWKKWHKILNEILSEDPDKRLIYWMYDETGQTGKSIYCDKYEIERLHECLVIGCTGSVRDIGDVIRNWMIADNVPRTILIDLPRTAEDKSSIYNILECVKNGRITCIKYSGTTLRFRRPHVVVFSNWLPDFSLLSLDRWAIYEIKDDTINKKDVKELIEDQQKKISQEEQIRQLKQELAELKHKTEFIEFLTNKKRHINMKF